MLEACLELSVDGAERKIALTNPAFPVELDRLNIRELSVARAVVDLNLFRHGDAIAVTVQRKVGQIEAVVQN